MSEQGTATKQNKYYYIYSCFACPDAPTYRSLNREAIVRCGKCAKDVTLIARFILTHAVAKQFGLAPGSV